MMDEYKFPRLMRHGSRIVTAEDGDEIAVATRSSSRYRKWTEQTAAEIVRRANAHDALVAALEDMVRLFHGYQGMQLHAACAALAAAKEAV